MDKSKTKKTIKENESSFKKQAKKYLIDEELFKEVTLKSLQAFTKTLWALNSSVNSLTEEIKVSRYHNRNLEEKIDKLIKDIKKNRDILI